MIEQEDVDGVTVVRLAHGKVNALDVELLREITAVFDRLTRSASRAVVLTGTGSCFSAGVDLWRVVDGGAAYVDAFLPALSDAFLSVFTLDKPVVAALNGHAIAGGAVLACAADQRLAVESGARIGVTELVAGVPFPPVALEIVRFAIGEQSARAAIVTGNTVDPPGAFAAGFVDRLVPADTLRDTALATARRLASIPPDTFGLTKQQLRLPVQERIDRYRPLHDARVRDLWVAGVEGGRLRRYMESVTAGR
ncbi:enoyl-CoA hydratase/isomerase family protein [Cryptosporangium aurantiacum]|uniref:Enoyl-CoA hydratase n=1 Tax=Cryptosporangium aurantiacum TaxID=134849 RepID=A0A1M7RM88_9ACTN|nr:enoyl-CoA hydratase/isomerase family protein [Cryptosporangium aurantiacum]SHN47290.1 enoyl-CoA hydratase [Cryptosporangium aurantiacum]